MDNLTNVKNPGVAGAVKTTPLTPKQLEQDKKLRKACADFESVLTSFLFKAMRKTVPSGLSVNQYAGKDTFDMLMDQKVAEELSKKNNRGGIQDLMYKQLIKKANIYSAK